MKSLLAFLIAISHFQTVLAEQNTISDDEIILPASPPQKIVSRYETNFSNHHDRGFYLSATLGPQWVHSIKAPEAKEIRFGGKFGLGGYVADGVALFGAAWGSFLEQASLVAGGPGVAFLFDGPNMSLDFSVGVGRAFTALKKDGFDDFAETVLAANAGLGKFWWISANNSLGISLNAGLHGFTITEGRWNSVGWNVGFGLAYLFG